MTRQNTVDNVYYSQCVMVCVDGGACAHVCLDVVLVFEDSTEVCYLSLLSHAAPLIAVRPQPGARDRDRPGASLPWVWGAVSETRTHSPYRGQEDCSLLPYPVNC